jgi:hypothetical protein
VTTAPKSPRETRETPVTGDQVREAMQAAGITYVEHHACGLCGYMTNYQVIDGALYFYPGCDCSYGPRERRSFQDAADWINMQSSDTARARLLQRFGLLPLGALTHAETGDPA